MLIATQTCMDTSTSDTPRMWTVLRVWLVRSARLLTALMILFAAHNARISVVILLHALTILLPKSGSIRSTLATCRDQSMHGVIVEHSNEHCCNGVVLPS
jgi:hypothetical protein